MSDENSTPADPPAGDEPAPPAGAAAIEPTPEGDGTEDGHDAAGDPRVAALSKENAATRRKLREAEQRLAEYERAQLSEVDRLKAEADDAKRALEEVRAEQARDKAESRVIAAAAAQRAVDPDAVWLLVRDAALAAGDDLDAQQLVKDTLKAKPYLQAPMSSGRDADPARSTSGPREETDDQRRARLRGGSVAGFFDPKTAAQRGGGVRLGAGDRKQ